MPNNTVTPTVHQLIENLINGFTVLVQVAERCYINEKKCEELCALREDATSKYKPLLPDTTSSVNFRDKTIATDDASWMAGNPTSFADWEIQRTHDGIAACNVLAKMICTERIGGVATDTSHSSLVNITASVQNQAKTKCLISSVESPVVKDEGDKHITETAGAKGNVGASVLEETKNVAKASSSECSSLKPPVQGEEYTYNISTLAHDDSYDDAISAELYDSSENCPEGPANKCPIRVMDKHSPEEIASYVEKHKHEIPRSHEVCLRRFINNPETAKKIDAKYGDMKTMMRSIGIKHQPLLPKDDDGSKVKKWVDDILNELSPIAMTEQGVHDGERSRGRCQMPLKAVRVGESPSRPWGVPVPTNKEPIFADYPASLNAVDSPPTSVSDIRSNLTAPHSPHLELNPKPSHSTHIVEDKKKDDAAKERGQVVFNGPVIIGYPAEQAAEFLRGTGYRFKGEADGNLAIALSEINETMRTDLKDCEPTKQQKLLQELHQLRRCMEKLTFELEWLSHRVEQVGHDFSEECRKDKELPC